MTDTSLTPREPRPDPRRPRGARRVAGWVIGAGLVVAVGWLIAGLLGDAALFFYNADEAVERREELGDDRFTLQGTPMDGSVVEGVSGTDAVVAFSVTFGGVVIDVVHTGDPPELFQPGVPVVLDGAWVASPAPVDGFAPASGDGWHFASDRMRVKHDNDYRSGDEYDDRVTDAERYGSSEIDQ